MEGTRVKSSTFIFEKIYTKMSFYDRINENCRAKNIGGVL